MFCSFFLFIACILYCFNGDLFDIVQNDILLHETRGITLIKMHVHVMETQGLYCL
jgi:hypothetical protein